MRTPGLLLVPVAMVLIASSAQARPSAPMTAAQDVRELGHSIEQIHPDPFRSVPRQKFESAVSELARKAPALDRDELLVGVLRIIGLLGPRNGHTGLFPLDPAHTDELHLYPLRLYDFADGLYVVDESGESGLVGSRLVAVAGVPIGRVLDLVEPLVPHDNASNLRGIAPHYLLVSEVLDGLGIVPGGGAAEFTFEKPGGEHATATLRPISASAYRSAFADPRYGHYPAILPTASRPMYLAATGKEMWVRTLAGGKAVYFGYNTVAAPPRALLLKLQRLVSRPKVKRVIVDLRLNGGGDNTTYGSLTTLFGSSTVDRRGRLYVLIGRATFSAAANFAAELDRDTRATFVGEPTGGGVETYGDVVPLLLPTLGWNVNIAARYHDRRRGPKDRRLAVGPDIRVDLTSADYFARRDPVLAQALKGL